MYTRPLYELLSRITENLRPRTSKIKGKGNLQYELSENVYLCVGMPDR